VKWGAGGVPVVRVLSLSSSRTVRDDGEVIIVQQRAALRWSSPFHVGRAPLPDDGPGHEQPDCPVDRQGVPGDLGVGVLGSDLVAEEARRLAGGVHDQRLGLRQLSPELVLRNAAIFDLMSSASRLGPANPSSQSA